MTDRIIVGRLAGAFGVKGEVRLKSFCAEPGDIAGYAPLYAPDGRRFASLRITGQAADALTARVDGIVTREQAEAFRGTDLLADRARLPPLPEDEFYHADLVGLPVLDGAGRPLGTVRAVLNHGAGDILEVERPRGATGGLSGGSSGGASGGASGGDTLLIPFTLAAVPVVDVAGRRIVADPPEDGS